MLKIVVLSLKIHSIVEGEEKMICNNCGRLINSEATVCMHCGARQDQQNDAQQQYQQPQYNTPPYHQPFSPYQGYNSGSKFSVPVIAMILVFVLGFASIWMTWINIKVSVYGQKTKETIDFTEIMEKDEDFEGYTGKLSYYELEDSIVSKSDYDEILNYYHVMKYAGIIGYILFGVALVSLFVNKKIMTITSLLASLSFLTSMIGGILYCSKTVSYMDDLMKAILGDLIKVDFDVNISIGAIVPFAAAVAVTVIGFVTDEKKDSFQAY